LFASSVKPGGNVPAVTLKVGDGEPLAVNVKLYVASTEADEGGVPLMKAAGWVTTIVTFCEADGSIPLVALTVKLNEPGVEGVPDKTPLVASSARPGGSVPPVTLKVGFG